MLKKQQDFFGSNFPVGDQEIKIWLRDEYLLYTVPSDLDSGEVPDT